MMSVCVQCGQIHDGQYTVLKSEFDRLKSERAALDAEVKHMVEVLAREDDKADKERAALLEVARAAENCRFESVEVGDNAFEVSGTLMSALTNAIAALDPATRKEIEG